MIFDERKGKTIVQEKKGSKFYKKVILEESVSLIEEPNSKTLDFFFVYYEEFYSFVIYFQISNFISLG